MHALTSDLVSFGLGIGVGSTSWLATSQWRLGMRRWAVFDGCLSAICAVAAVLDLVYR